MAFKNNINSNSCVSNVEIKTTIGSAEWKDILDKPLLFPPTPHTHVMGDVTGLELALAGKVNASDLAPVALSNNYQDLDNLPTIPSIDDLTIGDISGLQLALDGKVNTSHLAPVALSNNYEDLNNLPVIPSIDDLGIGDISGLQLALDGKANTTSLAPVALSNNYEDLNNLPTIPSIAGLATEQYVNDLVGDIESILQTI